MNKVYRLSAADLRNGIRVGEEIVSIAEVPEGFELTSKSFVYCQSPFTQKIDGLFDKHWMPLSVRVNTSLGHSVEMLFSEDGYTYSGTAQVEGRLESRQGSERGRGVPVFNFTYFWPQIALFMYTRTADSKIPLTPVGECVFHEAGDASDSSYRRYVMSLDSAGHRDEFQIFADESGTIVSYSRNAPAIRVTVN
jgi:hypothetical protein